MSEIRSDKHDKFETNFEPSAVCEQFKKITELSHPSGSENSLREYIVYFAESLGLKPSFYQKDATEPGNRVIVIRREGSGLYKDRPFVTLQAHTDMVCYPNKDIFPLHVFEYTDPNDGERWIKAGSKDSIAPAIIFGSFMEVII
jgi:dipeptidase D